MDLDPQLRSRNANVEHNGRTGATSSSSSSSHPPPQRASHNDSSLRLPPLTNGHQDDHNTSGDSDASPTLQPAQQQQHGGRGVTIHQQDHGQPHQGETVNGGAANATDDAEHDPNDPKKSRACEACRGLKVRCEPDPNDGPCKRCKKAGRNCVVTVPTRKRQKKTDSRVSDLEKKIDALTASLQARGPTTSGPGAMHIDEPAAPSDQLPPVSMRGHTEASPTNPTSAPPGLTEGISGRQSSWDNEGRAWMRAVQGSPVIQQSGFTRNTATPHSSSTSNSDMGGQQPPSSTGHKRKASQRREGDEHFWSEKTAAPTRDAPFRFTESEGDIVDRGLVSMDQAAEFFTRYNERMVQHLPAVVFPSSYTVADLRKDKPTLFLAIIAVASSEEHALQRILQRELMQHFAGKVFMTGEKSLELVQALHVAVIWYFPPEHFENLKFYQLVHMAAVMALDIGLGKKLPNKRYLTIPTPDAPSRRSAPVDATSIEARRTWLTCHFLTANASMALHRPILIRWTPFMAESLDILRTSPEAAPSDKYICQLIWAHRLAEDIGQQFSMDDPTVANDITDMRTQLAMKALEREMDRFVTTIPEELMQPSLRITLCVVSLYMHEMALHFETMSEHMRPPLDTNLIKDSIVPKERLSSAHINALASCLTAVDGIFTTFLSLDVLQIRCLPAFNFVRVAYGVVILMKIYFCATNPGFELGKILDKEHIRVEYYLEALIEKFRITASNNRCRPAAKFLVVLAMLRSWFANQNKPEGTDDKSGSRSDRPAEMDAASSSCPRSSPSAAGTRQYQQSSSQQPSYPQHAQNHSQGQQQQQQPQQQQQQRDARPNTPLHMLSEVAAESDPNTTRNNFFAHLLFKRQPQPFFSDSVQSGSDPSGSTPMSMGPPPNPSLSGTEAELSAAMEPAFPPVPWGHNTRDMYPAYWNADGLGDNGATAAPGLETMQGGVLGGLDPATLGGIMNGYEGGARMVITEPWFSDAFHGFSDPNLFPF